MMTGRPEPRRRKRGKSWSRVARAVRIRETWIIRVVSASLRPQVEETMIAGVMTPTTAATTCCRPSGISWPAGGTPFQAKTDAGVRGVVPIKLTSQNFFRTKGNFGLHKLYLIFDPAASGTCGGKRKNRQQNL